MTFKLIKMETKTSVRYLTFVWAAVLIMTTIVGFELKIFQNSGSNFFIDMIHSISWFMYGLLIATLVVSTFAVIIIRFYKGLLGDEGYLMHTLPVKTWQLITAKGIVATLAMIVSMIVGTLSIFVLVVANTDFLFIKNLVTTLFEGIKQYPLEVLVAIEWIAIVIVSIATMIYQMYASMAIGQLVNRYRKLLAVGAYLGISFALSIIGTVFSIIFVNLDSEYFAPYVWEGIGSYSDGLIAFILFSLAIFIVNAIQFIIFHIVTERILNKKLNLL